MAIEVECRNCGRILRAPDDAAGRRAKCPECSAVVLVHEDGDEFDEFFDTDFLPTEEPSGFHEDYEETPPRDRRDVRPCPVCGEYIKSRATRCRFCGESLRESRHARPGDRSEGWAIASLVLGIVSLVLFCLAPISVPLALMAVVFSVLEMVKASQEHRDRSGMAIAGLICGLIPLAFWMAILIAAMTDNARMFNF
ncbi:DUF4190 domain-containing protein [Thalassoroseus pseudoceratinae]|uniref:DUF4190 domain-containing protein n=1 Tax=Thalassoroseus pseudoceratinae TaxID=2713176 RepID=UPI00142470BA|nr:DUF4190 domain-containing protein [Thalassoroseus pseudoceratinae]